MCIYVHILDVYVHINIHIIIEVQKKMSVDLEKTEIGTLA